MINVQLINVVLSEQWVDSNPTEQLPAQGRLSPGLDVDQCTVEVVGESHLVVAIEFSMVLVRAGSDEVVSTVSSTYRLLYEAGREVNRRALGLRAVTDAWPTWRGHLEAVMAWMGLVPLRLPPVLPSGVLRLAEIAYDHENRDMSGFTLMHGTDPQTKRPVLVLFGPEAGRAVVYEDDFRHVPHATDIWTAETDPWSSSRPQPLTRQELDDLTARFR